MPLVPKWGGITTTIMQQLTCELIFNIGTKFLNGFFHLSALHLQVLCKTNKDRTKDSWYTPSRIYTFNIGTKFLNGFFHLSALHLQVLCKTNKDRTKDSWYTPSRIYTILNTTWLQDKCHFVETLKSPRHPYMVQSSAAITRFLGSKKSIAL